MPVTRKRKVEVARLAGFGLVLAGVLALVLAVLSAQNAGASDPGAPSRHLSCHTTGTDQIGWAVMYGACSATTTTGADTSSSQPDHQCGCNTTTTYVTTTTQEHHCGCSTTTESSTTTTASTTTISSTTPTTMGGSTGPIVTQGGGPTGPVTTAAVGGPGGVTGAGGVTGGGGSPTVVAGAEAAQQLPFTGSSSFPLAAIGIVFILCGGGLALRKRRLAR